MGVEGATVHGFRSAFRDWAGNETHFARELAEAALAHAIGDKALDEISKILGLTGKPEGVDGSRVEEMVFAGQIEEVARYCDVLNTYRVWLEYACSAISAKQLDWREAQTRDFIITRRYTLILTCGPWLGNRKTH
jgi:hypothetical protein